MAGAIGVHSVFARRALRAGAPRFAPSFALPSATRIDRRLVGGAALFGIGWGLAGLCPGPALVSAVGLSPATIAFVAAMLVSMGVYDRLFESAPRA
jgi:uncharacterized protein